MRSFFFCASTAACACAANPDAGYRGEQARIQLIASAWFARFAGLVGGFEQHFLLRQAVARGRIGCRRHRSRRGRRLRFDRPGFACRGRQEAGGAFFLGALPLLEFAQGVPDDARHGQD
ncbi:MAG: hypothetical protein WDO13_20540 [Verrucomicrobiota bacterium]